jgi:large subunit ribosomal protein L7/L12
MAELDKIVEQLSQLTVIEAAELAKKLESTWGVSTLTTSPISVVKEDEQLSKTNKEKSDYDVVLDSPGDKKISIIKEIKAIANVTLKEAKELVDAAPKIIKQSLPKDEAEEIKTKLESIGAKVTLK